MPIKPENKKRYPAEWPEIRERILARAQHACEQCKRPNHVLVLVTEEGWINPDTGDVWDDQGNVVGVCRMSEWPAGRMVKTVLTIAHLDHVPENCEPDNLRAWCQRCHNRYDAPHRAQTAREARRKRSGQAMFDFANEGS